MGITRTFRSAGLGGAGVPTGSSRVLMLCTAMGAGGGAEEQVIHLACGLKARGWSVQIASMLPTCPMPAGFEAHGIPVSHLGMRKSVPDPRGIRRFNRIVRAFRPDVVHSHLVHANLLGRVARIFQPVPALVSTLHSLTMTGVRRDWSPVFEVAHRMTDSLCDQTTAICHAAADYAIRTNSVPAGKMTVIQNAVDTNRFAPDPQTRDALRRELGLGSRFAWLAAGRLEVPKAYPVLLKAFAQLGGDSVLLICGQGSLRARLEARAVEFGVASRVRFLGLRQDMPAMMNAADGMVLSSDIEGLPLVLLQAAASGLPIVATDVGGNREAVVEGVNGFLIPPQSPERLAGAMGRLMALAPDAREGMGRRGRLRAGELFDAERVIDRWIDLYKSVLAPPRPVRGRPDESQMRLGTDANVRLAGVARTADEGNENDD